MGTPLYMAAEAPKSARARRVGRRVRFGIIAYEMFTGRPPVLGAFALAELR